MNELAELAKDFRKFADLMDEIDARIARMEATPKYKRAELMEAALNVVQSGYVPSQKTLRRLKAAVDKVLAIEGETDATTRR